MAAVHTVLHSAKKQLTKHYISDTLELFDEKNKKFVDNRSLNIVLDLLGLMVRMIKCPLILVGESLSWRYKLLRISLKIGHVDILVDLLDKSFYWLVTPCREDEACQGWFVWQIFWWWEWSNVGELLQGTRRWKRLTSSNILLGFGMPAVFFRPCRLQRKTLDMLIPFSSIYEPRCFHIFFRPCRVYHRGGKS